MKSQNLSKQFQLETENEAGADCKSSIKYKHGYLLLKHSYKNSLIWLSIYAWTGYQKISSPSNRVKDKYLRGDLRHDLTLSQYQIRDVKYIALLLDLCSQSPEPA